MMLRWFGLFKLVFVWENYFDRILKNCKEICYCSNIDNGVCYSSLCYKEEKVYVYFLEKVVKNE